MGILEEMERKRLTEPAEKLACTACANGLQELDEQAEKYELLARELAKCQADQAQLLRELEACQATSTPTCVVWPLAVLTALMALTLVVANLLALKLWGFANIAVDGGIWLFPLTYIAGDLLCELYGERTADKVALLSTSFGIAVMILLRFVQIVLPDYPSADNSVFDSLVDSCSIVMFASFLSFLAGQLVNNIIFKRIRQYFNRPSDYTKRSIGSSVVAHLVDALVFETIAFYGRLPLGEQVRQIIFAFVAGLMLEAMMLTPNYCLVNFLAARWKYRHGEVVRN